MGLLARPARNVFVPASDAGYVKRGSEGCASRCQPVEEAAQEGDCLPVGVGLGRFRGGLDFDSRQLLRCLHARVWHPRQGLGLCQPCDPVHVPLKQWPVLHVSENCAQVSFARMRRMAM